MRDGFFRNFHFCKFRKLPFFENQGRNEFFELFPNSSRLTKTRSDPNFCKKNDWNKSEIAVFQKLGSERVFRAFPELVPTRPDSS